MRGDAESVMSAALAYFTLSFSFNLHGFQHQWQEFHHYVIVLFEIRKDKRKKKQKQYITWLVQERLTCLASASAFFLFSSSIACFKVIRRMKTTEQRKEQSADFNAYFKLT